MGRQKAFKGLSDFWYYYKIHVIVGIFIFGAILYIFLIDGPQENSALDVVLIGNAGKVEQQKLQQAATDQMLGKNTHTIINMAFWPAKGGLTNPPNAGRQQKLVAMISAKDIDVLVMDKKAFLFYAKQRTFLNLDSLKQKLPKDAQFLKTRGMKNRNHVYGIKIGQNRQLKRAGYDTKNKILGIVANTEHEKRSIQFVKWLLH